MTSRGVFYSVAAPFGTYLGALLVLAQATGQRASVLPVWNPGAPYPAWLMPVVLLFAISGVAIALLVPALPWTMLMAQGRLRAASLFCRAFALNLVVAVTFISVWKVFAYAAPPRSVFISWQALVALAGAFLLLRRRVRQVGHRCNRSLLIGGFVFLIVLPSVLWNKTFVEDADGDGTEAFEFARSVATHQLPHWDLENGNFGFYPNFMLHAYPTQLSFIAIGESEGAQRFPVYFYAFGVFLVLGELVARRKRNLASQPFLILLSATVGFFLYHASFSSYAIVVDLGEPFGVDLFFTFLAVSAFYALTTHQRGWWGLFSLLMTMALSSGLPMVLLFLAGHVVARPRESWRRAARDVLPYVFAFFLPWLAYQGFVFLYSQVHPLGITKWAFTNLAARYPIGFDPAVALSVVAALGVISGLVPLAALGVALLRRDRIGLALTCATLGYIAMLTVFGRTHPHYITPIVLLPTAVCLRMLATTEDSARRTIVYGVWQALLCGLLILIVRADRKPVTAYRAFGARTLMLYDSYPQLVNVINDPGLGRSTLRVFLPSGKALLPWQRTRVVNAGWSDTIAGYLASPSQIGIRRRPAAPDNTTPWGISFHTWIRYADTEAAPGKQYDQILAAPHLVPVQPEGYVRRDLAEGWVLYYNPNTSIFGWLAR